jgi:hypothetical protein
MTAVVNCASLTSCDHTSWDLAFCLCDGGGCTPADPSSSGGPGYDLSWLGASNDNYPGIIGVYSTTATSASTYADTFATSYPSTAGSWANPSNALADDGSYAVVTTTFHDPTGQDFSTDYIMLTGYGFAIPTGATILGIAAALKGHGSDSHGDLILMGGGVGLTSGGSQYYMFDPRFNEAEFEYQGTGVSAQASPYVVSSVGFSGVADDSPITTTDWVVTCPTLADVQLGGSYGSCGGYPNYPAYKGFAMSQLKQTWSPAEVNDSSFGVVAKLVYTTSTFTPTVMTYNLNCFGLAVYYVGGTPPPPPTPPALITGQQPNVWISS